MTLVRHDQLPFEGFISFNPVEGREKAQCNKLFAFDLHDGRVFLSYVS